MVDFEDKDKLNLPDFPATLIPPSQLSAATRPNNHFEGVSVLSRRERARHHFTRDKSLPAWNVVKLQRKTVCEQERGEVGKLCLEEHSTYQQIPLLR